MCENTVWRCDIWQIVLSALLLGAVIFDFITYRIPNRLTIPGILLGIGFRWYLYGCQGAWQGAEGCMLAIAVLFVLFLLRIVGAGDVKLLAVVGSFIGSGIWTVLLYTCICTGVLGVLKLLQVWIAGRNVHLEEVLTGGNRQFFGTRMHLSLPIALGSAMFMAGGW